MYIAKNGDLIVLARDKKKELEEALKCVVYTSIEKTDIDYTFYNERYLSPEELAEAQKQARIAEIKEELNEIDFKSIRALRAGEDERLDELEAEAQALRDELHELMN